MSKEPLPLCADSRRAVRAAAAAIVRTGAHRHWGTDRGRQLYAQCLLGAADATGATFVARAVSITDRIREVDAVAAEVLAILDAIGDTRHGDQAALDSAVDQWLTDNAADLEPVVRQT